MMLVPWGGEGRVMTVDGYTTEPALLCRYSSMLQRRAVELEIAEGEEE